jgi:hypothetical protein
VGQRAGRWSALNALWVGGSMAGPAQFRVLRNRSEASQYGFRCPLCVLSIALPEERLFRSPVEPESLLAARR